MMSEAALRRNNGGSRRTEEAIGLAHHVTVISCPISGVNPQNSFYVIISSTYVDNDIGIPSAPQGWLAKCPALRSGRGSSPSPLSSPSPSSGISVSFVVGGKAKGAALSSDPFSKTGHMSFCKGDRHQGRSPHARLPPGDIFLRTFIACSHVKQCEHCLFLLPISGLCLSTTAARVKPRPPCRMPGGV